MFINNDTLFVLTLDGKVVLIDANKAEVIGSKEKSFVINRFDPKKLPRLKTILYDQIKYPDIYQFPDFVDGSKFKQALTKGLNKKEVQDYDKSRYYIMVYGAIDREGNCEIFMLNTTVDRKENKVWEKKVADWVTR